MGKIRGVPASSGSDRGDPLKQAKESVMTGRHLTTGARPMSGAGHIRKRGATSWELRWPLPAGPDGKRRIGTETFKGSQREASRLLAQRVAEADSGMAAVP